MSIGVVGTLYIAFLVWSNNNSKISNSAQNSISSESNTVFLSFHSINYPSISTLQIPLYVNYTHLAISIRFVFLFFVVVGKSPKQPKPTHQSRSFRVYSELLLFVHFWWTHRTRSSKSNQTQKKKLIIGQKVGVIVCITSQRLVQRSTERLQLCWRKHTSLDYIIRL